MVGSRKINPPVMIAFVSSALFIAVVTAGYLYFVRDVNPIPQSIRQQLNFSPLVIPISAPKDISSREYKFSTMEDGTKVLTYIINLANDSITVTEYAQPPQFTEIADYKDRFLANVIEQYDSVQTSNGTIYLGRQSRQDKKQVGVMLERGLLVLMSPQDDLTKDQWRVIGDNLNLQKIDN